MKDTLKVLNGMLKAGVVERYAIGRAVAAIYYLKQRTVNLRSLMPVLRRHGLAEKWKQNEYRFKR